MGRGLYTETVGMGFGVGFGFCIGLYPSPDWLVCEFWVWLFLEG